MEPTGEFEGVTARIGTAIGRSFGPSEWFVVDQPKIDAFATSIDAMDPIHTDPLKAANSRFGGTIAHGFYIAGLIPKLLRQIYRPEGVAGGMAYGVEKLRFPSVVRSGCRVRLIARLDSVEAAGAAAIASFAVTVEVEGEAKPACVANVLLRYTGVSKND